MFEKTQHRNLTKSRPKGMKTKKPFLIMLMFLLILPSVLSIIWLTDAEDVCFEPDLTDTKYFDLTDVNWTDIYLNDTFLNFNSTYLFFIDANVSTNITIITLNFSSANNTERLLYNMTSIGDVAVNKTLGNFTWTYIILDIDSVYNRTILSNLGFINYTFVGGFSTKTFNYSQDNVTPAIEITSPTGVMIPSLGTDLIYNITEPHLDTCWYTVNNATNISLGTAGNCTNTSILVSGDGVYTVYVFANDTSGNTQMAYRAWQVKQKTDDTPPGGGTGGGAAGGQTYERKCAQLGMVLGPNGSCISIKDEIISRTEETKTNIQTFLDKIRTEQPLVFGDTTIYNFGMRLWPSKPVWGWILIFVFAYLFIVLIQNTPYIMLLIADKKKKKKKLEDD